MTTRAFVAGAAGAIGHRLLPILREAGLAIIGTTRSHERAAALAAQGVTPVIVDIFDSEAVTQAVVAARPDVIIHQLTDLSSGNPWRDPSVLVANARIREQGTANLVKAAYAAGTRRMIAQSIAFVYAPGDTPYDEEDPLDLGSTGTRKISVDGVRALEESVLSMPKHGGIVLRYGLLYGPGTGSAAPAGPCPVHVDAAAHAAFLAIDKGGGIYNITDNDSEASNARAVRELHWNPAFRLHVWRRKKCLATRGALVMPNNRSAE